MTTVYTKAHSFLIHSHTRLVSVAERLRITWKTKRSLTTLADSYMIWSVPINLTKPSMLSFSLAIENELSNVFIKPAEIIIYRLQNRFLCSWKSVLEYRLLWGERRWSSRLQNVYQREWVCGTTALFANKKPMATTQSHSAFSRGNVSSYCDVLTHETSCNTSQHMLFKISVSQRVLWSNAVQNLV